MSGLLDVAEVVRVPVVRKDAFDAVGCALRSQVMNTCSPITRVNLTGSGPGVQPGVDEVQRITVTPAASPGGTFTLTFNGQTTGTIAWNASAATVQTALVALSNVDPGDVTASGGILGTSPVDITFGGQYDVMEVPQITATGTGLVNASVATSTVTAGDPPDVASVTGKDANVFGVLTSLGSRPQCSPGTETKIVEDAIEVETEKAAAKVLWGVTGDNAAQVYPETGGGCCSFGGQRQGEDR